MCTMVSHTRSRRWIRRWGQTRQLLHLYGKVLMRDGIRLKLIRIKGICLRSGLQNKVKCLLKAKGLTEICRKMVVISLKWIPRIPPLCIRICLRKVEMSSNGHCSIQLEQILDFRNKECMWRLAHRRLRTDRSLRQPVWKMRLIHTLLMTERQNINMILIVKQVLSTEILLLLIRMN